MATLRNDLPHSEVYELCKQYTGRVHVQHVRLDQGGYTSDGVYFGIGPRLYHIWDDEDYRSDYIRASTRAVAVAEARHYYPNAKIQP